MQTISNNIASIQPASKKDLGDFFRETRLHYPGYIKQSVFRDKLVRIVGQAYHDSLRAATTTTATSIYQKVDFGLLLQHILDEASKEEWRPISQLKTTTSQEKYDAARQYFEAAGVGVAVDKITGKVAALKSVKKGVDKVALVSSKQLSKVGKIDGATRTKIIDAVFDMSDKGGSKLAPQSVAKVTTGRATGHACDAAVSLIPQKNNQVEVFQMQFSSNEAANGIIDFTTDFNPIAAVSKLTANVGGNAYMSLLMLYEASQTSKNELESSQYAKDLNAKIRRCISDDFKSFQPADLAALVNYLGIK